MNAELLVTGATGFTGQFVCKELLQRQVKFDCLVRPTSDKHHIEQLGLDWIEGNLNDLSSLRQAFKGYQRLINVASLGFGAAQPIVQACEEVGIQRAIFVSTTAIFTQLNAKSKAIRKAAEACIMSSTLDYTILRPTMIYGTASDRNMIRLLKLLEKSPIIPVFGDGKSLQQPVHVADVAWAIAEVMNTPATYCQSYNISGKQVLSYNEVIQLAAQALGKQPILLHIPQTLSIRFLEFVRHLGIKAPVTPEQVLRLNEDKTFDHSAATHDFNYLPRTFQAGIRQEVACL